MARVLFRIPRNSGKHPVALISLLTVAFYGSMSFAASEVPQTFTLDGKLYVVGTTTPLQDAAAKINIQIIDPTGRCVLYEEEQTVNTVTSEGYFHINVGSDTGAGKRTVNDPGRTMAQIFQNTTAISANNVSGQTCPGASYTPAAGAVRYFRVTVTPTSGTPDVLTPDIVIDSAPSAIVAQSVQGLERASILQVNNSGSTVLTQANLEAVFTTPAYTNLQSILAGNFIKTDSSGATLPSYAADPAGSANGDIWFDSTTGQIKYQNGSGVQTVGTGSSGISSLTVGSSMSINGTVGGTISGASGTIDLANTGVGAGTYTKVTVDTKGRVTAGTVSLSESDIPNLTTAGKVSGNTITSGTISGSAGINTSGSLITTGTVSGLTVQATNLRIYNGSNYIQMTAPALGGNVNLTLPADDGNSGEVLSTDGNGVLSWVASLTNSLASGKIWVGSGSNVATAVSMSGDGTLSNTGNLTIDSGTSANKIVRLDGSARMPAVDASALTNLTAANISGTLPINKGGTAATSFTANAVIVSNGTGSALQALNCTLGQVITFDASGYAVCGAGGSTGFVNGGNSFGADATLGTNDNKALKFEVNNTTAMTISQSGNVGIGTATPSALLAVSQTNTATSGTHKLTDISYVLNPTANSTAGSAAMKIYAGGSLGTKNYGSMTGVDTYVYADTSGTINSLTGTTTTVKNQWGGTITNLTGSSIWVETDGNSTGTITGIFNGLDVSSATASSPIYGINSYIYNGNSSGNSYNLYLDTFFGNANTFDIYQKNAGVKNYFAGKIGVGISTPSTALDISGAVNMVGIAAPAVSASNEGRIYYDRTANKFKVSQNGGAYADLVAGGAGDVLNNGNTLGAALTVGTNDVQPLNFEVNNTTAMTISQGGNVGIGTSSPSDKLHVSGNGRFIGNVSVLGVSRPSLRLGSTTNSAANIEYMGSGSNYEIAGDISGDLDIENSSNINFSADGWTNHLSIRNSGNIGIATTAPSSALDINGALTAQGMSSAPAVSPANTGRIYYDFSANKFKVSQNGAAYADLVGGGIAGTVSVGQGGTGATSFAANAVIVSNGTGTALTALNCTVGQVIAFDASGYAICGSSSGFVNGGNSYGADATLGTNDGYALNFETNNATAMTISQSGNVGIGTNAPDVALDVQGQIRSRTTDVTGSTTVNWNNGNTQYTTDSCQAYTFNNMVDGGNYTFIVKGATSAQCTFTAAGLTFHFTPSNAPTNANTHSIYNLLRAGSDVYVSWTTGL